MSWQPHTVTSTEFVDPGPVAALTALLDSGAPAVAAGDVLPPLWHWVALPRWPASSRIGSDGHPVRGSFLPPVRLPRRMFAGGEIECRADILVGSTVRREATVVSVTPKSGRSGDLVLVTVEITLYNPDDRPALVERQNLIYREGAPARAEPLRPPDIAPAGKPLSRTGPGRWELRTDPTLLMRFSAATANPHRIHYDWPYATGAEGYPGLVVHGPLMTLSLAETLRHDAPDSVPAVLRHRNIAPLFCAQPARIEQRDTGTGFALAVAGTDASGAAVTHTELSGEFRSREGSSDA
ncbi:MAG: MaoC family dehydratase N-terminal domain-containing protein [Nocardia sp.]|nr:MaoC family dehydratase N-terminal domain-containing protein [Nocardia sp.]